MIRDPLWPLFVAMLAVLVYVGFSRGQDHVPLAQLPGHLVGRLRARVAKRRAWAEGADLVAGLDELHALSDQDPFVDDTPTAELVTLVVRDDRCRCGGRHCYYHRHGLECPPQRAPALTYTLWSNVGRHSPSAVFANVVPPSWTPLAYLRRRRIQAVAS